MESRLMLRFDQFTREKVLGTGSFGKVWLGRYNDAEVAVKELNPYATQTKYIVSEMETLAQLSHPNIITLYGLCIVDEGIFILTEYAAKGDLRKKLDSSHVVFSLKLKCKILKETAAAMSYLHGKKLMHRDLKSQNLLLMGDDSIKLCDFGLTRKEEDNLEGMTANVGTMEWMAPEVINGHQYDQSVDVFSYGVLIYEVLTRNKPPRRNILLNWAFNPTPTQPPPDTPDGLWELMLSCASVEPGSRPSFADLVGAMTNYYKNATGSVHLEFLQQQPAPSPTADSPRKTSQSDRHNRPHHHHHHSKDKSKNRSHHSDTSRKKGEEGRALAQSPTRAATTTPPTATPTSMGAPKGAPPVTLPQSRPSPAPSTVSLVQSAPPHLAPAVKPAPGAGWFG